MTTPQSRTTLPEGAIVDAPLIDLRERQRPSRPPVVEATMPTAADDRRPSRAAVVGVTFAAVLVVGFYVALPIGLLARAILPQAVFLAPVLIVSASVVAIRRVLRATDVEPVIDLTDPRP